MSRPSIPADRPLDVTIITHNRAGPLAELLRALERQTLSRERWRIVVVANACKDGTVAVARAAAARGGLPELMCVEEPQPGVPVARRRAVREASAPLVALLDDDVVLDDDFLARALAFFDTHPSAGLVGGPIAVRWQGEPHPVARARPEAFGELDYGPAPRRLTVEDRRGLIGAAVVARRDALLACGWMERSLVRGRRGDDLQSGEDTELFLQVLRAGYEAWYDPALRLQHLIPSSRTGLPQLCRLYEGFGTSREALAALRTGYAPTRVERWTRCAVLLADLARESARLLARRLWRRDTPDDALRWHVRRGRVRGAWRACASAPAP